MIINKALRITNLVWDIQPEVNIKLIFRETGIHTGLAAVLRIRFHQTKFCSLLFNLHGGGEDLSSVHEEQYRPYNRRHFTVVTFSEHSGVQFKQCNFI